MKAESVSVAALAITRKLKVIADENGVFQYLSCRQRLNSVQ